ncbi:MAG: hypothetical protein ACXV8J_08415, partial [Methylobacter sp.]
MGSYAQNYTLDTSAAAVTAALALDSGTSASDGITSNGQINVTGLESGATWQYSVDGGNHWISGSGTSFTLAGTGPVGTTYAAGQVQVQQTDVAGNASAIWSNSSIITVDTWISTPTVTGPAVVVNQATEGAVAITVDHVDSDAHVASVVVSDGQGHTVNAVQ